MVLTNIVVKAAKVSFESMTLATPLTISERLVDRCTLARVSLSVCNRAGLSATGSGLSVLSVPWSWPNAEFQTGDAAMRAMVRKAADGVLNLPAGDPIQLWTALESRSQAWWGDMPALAATLCVSAVDSALHDAWGRCAGRDSWSMYTADFLHQDLSVVGLPSVYPGEFLNRSREEFPIQHVVGTQDRLDASDPDSGVTLEQSLRHTRTHHLKIKTGADVSVSAARIRRIYLLAERVMGPGVRLVIDPNEALPDLDHLRSLAQHLDGLPVDYIEQPVQRAVSAVEPVGVPVLLDEGLATLDDLERARTGHWDGFVLKAAKGQTASLLANAYAKHHGMAVAVQDLATVDLALLHSARLTQHVQPQWHHIECNARQYAPQNFLASEAVLPGVRHLQDGLLRLPPKGAGLY